MRNGLKGADSAVSHGMFGFAGEAILIQATQYSVENVEVAI